MMSISTTLFGKISHASLFITGQLWNPWQMLAEPWGSAEPRLKNTALTILNEMFLSAPNKPGLTLSLTLTMSLTLSQTPILKLTISLTLDHYFNFPRVKLLR